MSTTFHTITLGKGTNKLDAEQYWSEASYERLSLPECDQSDEPYSDSSIQFILAYNPKLAKTTVSNLIK